MITLQHDLEKIILSRAKDQKLTSLKGHDESPLPAEVQKDVIALDYLVTLFQLNNLIGVKKDMDRFTSQSHIGQIL
jgi:hypothetical protein